MVVARQSIAGRTLEKDFGAWLRQIGKVGGSRVWVVFARAGPKSRGTRAKKIISADRSACRTLRNACYLTARLCGAGRKM